MNVGRSKSGLPTLTENGGGSTNTGSATCIAAATGAPLTPLFVPKGYSNGDHAIFAVKPGYVVAEAGHDRGGEVVSVYRIREIYPPDHPEKPNLVELSAPVYEYGDGDEVGDANFRDVAKAALAKSKCYHCREPHYINAKE